MTINNTNIRFYIINMNERYWRKIKTQDEEERAYRIFKDRLDSYLPLWKEKSSTPESAIVFIHMHGNSNDLNIVDDDEETIKSALKSIKEQEDK